MDGWVLLESQPYSGQFFGTLSSLILDFKSDLIVIKLYRETDKRGTNRGQKKPEIAVRAESVVSTSPIDQELDNPFDPNHPKASAFHILSRPKNEPTSNGMDRNRERTLVGSLTNSYKFKPNGMMKKVQFY